MYQVVITCGGTFCGTKFLTEVPTIIGRGSDCTIILPHTSISRMHAVITVDYGGHIMLTDLKSTNGVKLNGKRLKEHTAPLLVGDRLSFGPYTVAVAECIHADMMLAA